MEPWLTMLATSLAVASISWTITKSKVFHKFRMYLSERPKIGNFLYGLFSCPYCLSHWISGIAVIILQYRLTNFNVFIDLLIAAFATVTIAAGCGGYLIRIALKLDDDSEQIMQLEKTLLIAKQKIQELSKQD